MPLHGVSFTSASEGAVVGNSGTILRTTDGGSHWNSQRSGTTAHLWDVSFSDANSGTAVGEGGTIVKTTDGGNHWVTEESGTPNTFYDVFFTDANNGTAVGDLGMIRRRTDAGGSPLTLASAASVKGAFAINLPLTGPSGVEDRSGGPNKKYTVVMTFNQNIVSVGSASSTCGAVQSIVIDSADAHRVKVNLVNVAHGCNESTIIVTADNISDDQGNVLDSASVGMGLLLGDVNGDRVVNQSDYHEAQMNKGQKADQQNFRSDVTADSHITSSDIQFIRQQQGTSLP